MITAGIDVGSITTKAALLEGGKILGTRLLPTGYNAELAGRRVFEELLAELGIAARAVERLVATGYGRGSVRGATKAITEITCHGAGAYLLDPQVRAVIDIGGQDSKVIVLDAAGKVKNFAMNDKCAAGTGRFLEVMAGALGTDLDGFGALSLKAPRAAKISSLCTVFAESEVISLVAAGEAREVIIAGIHEAIAARVAALASRVGITTPVVMTGGVAKNAGVVLALERKLGVAIAVSIHAQLNGAIGAAVLAGELK